MSSLTDATRKILEGRHYATLATQDLDGTVHLTPVWYLFENDRLHVACPFSSHKAQNVVQRPMASIVVDLRKPGAERWVAASGFAKVLQGDESKAINGKVQRRYLTKEAIQNPKIGPVLAAIDDATIVLTPTRWRSWAAKAIDDRFFGGILGAAPEKWFLPVDV